MNSTQGPVPEEVSMTKAQSKTFVLPGSAVVAAPWTLQEGPRRATASNSANLFMATSSALLDGPAKARCYNIALPDRMSYLHVRKPTLSA